MLITILITILVTAIITTFVRRSKFNKVANTQIGLNEDSLYFHSRIGGEDYLFTEEQLRVASDRAARNQHLL